MSNFLQLKQIKLRLKSYTYFNNEFIKLSKVYKLQLLIAKKVIKNIFTTVRNV